jgi:NADPH-dependent 7-cyano-7-deazaguanine reductase QueF
VFRRSLNIVMSIYPNTLEPIYGPELSTILKEMEQIFPPVTPTPDWTASQIMYRSGQRAVVEWLIQRIEN